MATPLRISQPVIFNMNINCWTYVSGLLPPDGLRLYITGVPPNHRLFFFVQEEESSYGRVSNGLLVPKYCEFMYNWFVKSSLNGNSFRINPTCQFLSHNHSQSKLLSAGHNKRGAVHTWIMCIDFNGGKKRESWGHIKDKI